jgi:hypothetical protein
MSKLNDLFQRYTSLGKRDSNLESEINRELRHINLSLQQDVEPNLEFIKKFHEEFCKELNIVWYVLIFTGFKIRSRKLIMPSYLLNDSHYRVPNALMGMTEYDYPYKYTFEIRTRDERHLYLTIDIFCKDYTPDSNCELLIRNSYYTKSESKDYSYGRSVVKIEELFKEMNNFVLNCYVTGNEETCERNLLEMPDDLRDIIGNPEDSDE